MQAAKGTQGFPVHDHSSPTQQQLAIVWWRKQARVPAVLTQYDALCAPVVGGG